MAGQRPERVARQVLQEVSDLAERELSDPRLALVTFTGARMSPDLRVAWIYYSCMPGQGEDARLECERALEHAAGMLKRQVGRRLRLRYVPDLRFRYDDSLERADRISQLLEDAPAADAEPDADAVPGAATDAAADPPHGTRSGSDSEDR
jgi:ribosome-binding factor A